MTEGTNLPGEIIPHGPVYGGSVSNAGMVLLCLNLLLAAITSQTPAVFFFGPLVIVSFIVFMNYMGVEIDHQRKKIRLYHSFLGIRWGAWQNLDKFEKVVLYFLSSSMGVQDDEAGFSSRSYTIELIGKTKKHRMELDEIPCYEEALDFAQNIAKRLNKPFVNVIEVALKNRNPGYY